MNAQKNYKNARNICKNSTFKNKIHLYSELFLVFCYTLAQVKLFNDQ